MRISMMIIDYAFYIINIHRTYDPIVSLFLKRRSGHSILFFCLHSSHYAHRLA
ncbi:hypothetical protein F018LOC_03005 [Pectobacterium versatile]|nr:hypothetical protein F018LOC_03005 [Pectobacterium versatile]